MDFDHIKGKESRSDYESSKIKDNRNDYDNGRGKEIRIDYDNVRTKESRSSSKNTYSPPPRLLKQKAHLEAHKNQNKHLPVLQNRDRLFSAGHSKRSLASEFTEQSQTDEWILPLATAWQNFRFDKKALFSASFGS